MKNFNSIVKPAFLIPLSTILLILLIKFIIDYTGLLGTNDIHFYNFDQKYKNQITSYKSDASAIAFEYPAKWTHNTIITDKTTTETIFYNENNIIEISYIHVNDLNPSMSVTQIIDNNFIDLTNELLKNNYIIIDEGNTYFNNEFVKYTKFKHINSYCHVYSWVNNNNYLCTIKLIYEETELNNFNIFFETLRFFNPNEFETYKSDHTSLTFNYPITFSKLGVFVDDFTNNIDETLVKDENTSITISLRELEELPKKDYVTKIINPLIKTFQDTMLADNYENFSGGSFDARSNDVYYQYYRKDNAFIYVYYWTEEYNDKIMGGTVTFRFTNSDSSLPSTILRSVYFGKSVD